MRTCIECGSNTTGFGKRISNKTGNLITWQQWFKVGNGFKCKKCWNREYSRNVSNPKRDPEKMRQYTREYNKKNPEKLKENNKRRLSFKGKIIYLRENPRKNICVICGKKVSLSHIHHDQYHDDDPLKDTREICPSHHSIETRKRLIPKKKECYICFKEFITFNNKKIYCSHKCGQRAYIKRKDLLINVNRNLL